MFCKNTDVLYFSLDIFKEIMYNRLMKKKVIIIIFGLILLSGVYSCPTYRIFGIPCPSCGVTRAYRLFLSGHFREAFLMHPLFLLPAALLFKPFQNRRFFIGMLVVFIAVYAVRMCLMFPNTEPMIFNRNSILGGILR